MTDREDMIAEALDLGIKHKGNISNIALAEKLAEFKGEPPPLDETPPPGPATKPEPEAQEEDEVVQTKSQKAAHSVFLAKRMKIAKAKKKALKTHIVTITNKDNRENDVMTTAFLSFENQYFGIAKNVPLDVPVELEAALIDIAERCKMTLHKDEIVKGRRTGNKVPVTVNKYAVSFGRPVPE